MQVISIHPDRFHGRQLQSALEALRAGKLVVYPTDSVYGVGCLPGRKGALDRLYRLRDLSWSHPFSVLCPDIARVSEMAVVSNSSFRYIKRHAPGPYTFILPTIKRIERQLKSPRKRHTIGFRIPGCDLLQELLQLLGEPLASMSLHHPETDEVMIDPVLIEECYGADVAVMIDCGEGCQMGSTVIDLTSDLPSVLRQGRGLIRD